jgi:hypothetical protein
MRTNASIAARIASERVRACGWRSIHASIFARMSVDRRTVMVGSSHSAELHGPQAGLL